jgi:hypothetical protein
MCACKETDMRESPNDSTLAGGEGQGSRGETCHPNYRESPVSSVAEHSLFCHCPALAVHRMKIHGSGWVELTDISIISVKQVLALALRTGHFWRALPKTGEHYEHSSNLSTRGDRSPPLPDANTQYSSGSVLIASSIQKRGVIPFILVIMYGVLCYIWQDAVHIRHLEH